MSIAFSPWSLKTKWALLSGGIDFVSTEKPLLEWPLRWRLGIPADESAGGGTSDGKLTFPILALRDGSLIRQSLDIAKWAHRLAAPGKGLGGPRPDSWDNAIDDWDAKGVQLMRFGRQVAMNVAARDDEKAVEMVRLLGVPVPGDALKLKVGRFRSAVFSSKYSAEGSSTSSEEAASILEELQAHLQRQSSVYILNDAFSYADVCMVLGLHCIRPYKGDLPLGMLAPVLGATLEDLASKYESLFAWGQGIIDKHLPPGIRVEHS